MRLTRSGMESDGEDSSAGSQKKSPSDEQYDHYFTIPPRKARRRIRPQALKQLSTGSTSGFSSCSLATDASETTTSDIFYIYNPVKAIDSTQRSEDDRFANRQRYKQSRMQSKGKGTYEMSGVVKKRKPKLSTTTSSGSMCSDSLGYMKHSNLDVRALTLSERFRLARVHYFTISNGIRLALVLFCLGYFLFNAYKIFCEFQTHDTVVFMEFRSPSRSFPPAITICSHCVLCSPYISNSTLTKISVRDILSMGNPNDDLTQAVPYASTSDEDALLQQNNIDINCTLYTSTMISQSKQISCSKIAPVVISIQEGRRCNTYFSDIDGRMRQTNLSNPELAELNFDLFPLIQIDISGMLLKPPNINDASDSSGGVFISLHDPTTLSYMSDSPLHRIVPQKLVDIRFQKSIEVLKKPPYSTMCYNYTLTTKKPEYWPSFWAGVKRELLNNWYQMTYFDLWPYSSIGQCFNYCLFRRLNAHRCVNVFSIFTDDLVNATEYWYWKYDRKSLSNRRMFNRNGRLRFCSNSSYADYLNHKQGCMASCNSPCYLQNFNMDPNILEYNGASNMKGSTVKISWAPEPYTYISHKTKLDENEFLGQLGGHLHVWLGISVLHVIRWSIRLLQTGEFLPDTNCCCMLVWWKSFVTRKRYPDY